MYISEILLPQMTNRESWTFTVALHDDDTGEPIALTDANNIPIVTFQLEVRRSMPGRGYGGGYSNYYSGIGSISDGPVLTASLGNGITIVDTGVIQIYFSETQMRSLCGALTWNVGCTMASTDGIDVRQIFRAKLPILEGYVTN